MRIILHSLLLIAVTFGYVAGPYLTFEMEHSHESCESHGHEHTGDGHDHHPHSHHPHDHAPVPSSEIPESDEPGGHSHSHTHLVSLGADSPFTPTSHNTFMANRMGANHPAAIAEFAPDGPCFPLIKPPQLG